MVGGKADDLLEGFHAIACRFSSIAPGGYQLSHAGAFIFFVFDDEDFLLRHVCWIPLSWFSRCTATGGIAEKGDRRT